jgi:hypothetical protein
MLTNKLATNSVKKSDLKTKDLKPEATDISLVNEAKKEIVNASSTKDLGNTSTI